MRAVAVAVERDVEQPVIGVIGSQPSSELGLASAAARQPGWSLRSLAIDEPAVDGLAGLVVDVPLAQRAAVLERLARWSNVPVLIESPVCMDLVRASLLEDLARHDNVVAANPLRYALHTRRLLEEVALARDPLETYFAAWRFRAQSSTEHALPQLLDYLRALCPEQPARISAMQHPELSIVLVTLRYASNVLGSIEVGGHLPHNFPSASELVLECFCEASAYTCEPGRQSVEVYGGGQGAYNWQPEPADAMVAAFAGWLHGGVRPPGSLTDELTNLRLVNRISRALQADGVFDSAMV